MAFIPDEPIEGARTTPSFVPDETGVIGGGGQFRGVGVTGDIPQERTLTNLLSNIGRNATEITKGTYEAVRHPVETGKILATLAAGTIGALVPDVLQTKISPEIQQAEKLAKGVGGRIVKAAEDPVQFAFENPIDALSTLSVFTKGAGVLAETGGLAKTANILSKTSQVLEPTQLVTIPIKTFGKAVTSLPGLKGLPVGLYASALKPKLIKGKDNLANTLKVVEDNLNKGRTVSQKVWRQTQKEINRYKDDIKNVIDRGTANGDTINIDDIVANLDNLKKDVAFADMRPDLLEKAVERTKTALKDYHINRSFWMGRGRGQLSPDEVQRLKTRQWNAVEKKFGELNVAYKSDIQKSLGHGAKKSLEKLYPELEGLNLKAGELIEFNGHIEKALKSHLLSDEVRNLAFLIKAIVDNPTAKSKLAIWLNRAQKGNPLANPKALERNLLIQLGRVEALQERQEE